MKMSQMYQTEICECGKLKQVNRACKTCGFTILTQPQDEAFYRPDRIPVAKALPVEDDIERARR